MTEPQRRSRLRAGRAWGERVPPLHLLLGIVGALVLVGPGDAGIRFPAGSGRCAHATELFDMVGTQVGEALLAVGAFGGDVAFELAGQSGVLGRGDGLGGASLGGGVGVFVGAGDGGVEFGAQLVRGLVGGVSVAVGDLGALPLGAGLAAGVGEFGAGGEPPRVQWRLGSPASGCWAV